MRRWYSLPVTLRGLCAAVPAGWGVVEPVLRAVQASVTDTAAGRDAAHGGLPARESETCVVDALMAYESLQVDRKVGDLKLEFGSPVTAW